MIVWVMGAIVVCLLWFAACSANRREDRTDAIIREEIDQPRKYRADKRNATVRAMEGLE